MRFGFKKRRQCKCIVEDCDGSAMFCGEHVSKQVELWKADAQRYAQNAEYHRTMREAAEAELAAYKKEKE